MIYIHKENKPLKWFNLKSKYVAYVMFTSSNPYIVLYLTFTLSLIAFLLYIPAYDEGLYYTANNLNKQYNLCWWYCGLI